MLDLERLNVGPASNRPAYIFVGEVRGEPFQVPFCSICVREFNVGKLRDAAIVVAAHNRLYHPYERNGDDAWHARYGVEAGHVGELGANFTDETLRLALEAVGLDPEPAFSK